ncbi:hypothetical protein [Polyangium spumosum]|uniref:DUF3341 domain-containing protein n=1 Tax=Polyangium spumosum TaxID=889282 RepID=A0A6N7Q1T2_9BACT|nr:hypothetical protein [Polyangium spumosum]MRG97677.1 hypothetical protein [Polyangium spumosum]
MKHEILIAFFFERAHAEGALAELASLGVSPGDVSVIPKHVGHRGDLGLHLGSKASEGAAIGAALGGLLGAIAGALGAAGSLVVPATGSVFAGPVVAAAAGAGVLGALGVAVGGILGARHPEFEARLLEDAVGMGGSLVAIRAAAASAGAVERLLEARGASFVRRQEAEA